MIYTLLISIYFFKFQHALFKNRLNLKTTLMSLKVNTNIPTRSILELELTQVKVCLSNDPRLSLNKRPQE